MLPFYNYYYSLIWLFLKNLLGGRAHERELRATNKLGELLENCNKIIINGSGSLLENIIMSN